MRPSSVFRDRARPFVAILSSLLMVFPSGFAQQAPPAPASSDAAPAKPLPPEQLDSLVAPIALYPDPVLSQVLVASTYPLEIVQCDRWYQENKDKLKDKALADAVAKQSWDASVQALVTFPDVLKQLDDNISWTSDLGNAFLDQEGDVMAAVQRLRQKAQESGQLKTTEQQKVTTTTEDNKQYIVVQPANPEVIYVPAYNPTVIWGPPPVYYPYPPVYYPSTGAVIAAGAISFGVGVAMGAMWSGGGWGWGAGWGHSNVTINNTFIRSNNFNRTSISNNNTWQHNAAHRGGVPYNNRNVANRYNQGGVNQGGVNQARANRPNSAQTRERLSNPGASRPAGGAQNRAGNAGQGNVGQNRAAGGGSDRMGNRQVSGGNFGSSGRSAFGDMNQGGGRARQNSSRGASSMGSRGGGGRR